MGMIDTDLVTDEDLRELLKTRYEAKDLAFCFVWAQDDGEAFEIDHDLDYEQIVDVTDVLVGDAEWQIEDLDDCIE